MKEWSTIMSLNNTKSESKEPLEELDRSLRRDRIRALVEPLAAHRGAAAVIMTRLLAHTRLVRVGEQYCLAVFDNPHGNGAGDLKPGAILELLSRIYRQNPRLFSVNPTTERGPKIAPRRKLNANAAAIDHRGGARARSSRIRKSTGAR
jgi:hypothetical protein